MRQGAIEFLAVDARSRFDKALDAVRRRTNNVSLNTVYTHLRRVREKTGCHSIADLVRKLDEFRIPLL